MFFEDHGILFQQSVLLGQSTDCMKVQSRTAAFVVRMDSLACTTVGLTLLPYDR